MELTNLDFMFYPPEKRISGGICMKGSIFFQKDRKRYAISWYQDGKNHIVTRYKNEFMYHKKIAEKCLAMIQSDFENSLSGLSNFRIEKYTGQNYTDIIPFFEKFLKLKERKKPATIKGYGSYFKCWIKPFFEKNNIMLHEIQLDTLYQLMDYIALSGKGKYNVMNCFHTFIDYAWRSKRIPEMPPFPVKSDYNIKEPDFDWYTEEEQLKVIDFIPKDEQPIFLWLKYHYKRTCEGIALKWCDYDEVNNAFLVRRSISARQLVESTKTGQVDYIPCAPEFIGIMFNLKKQKHSPDDFIFQNPRGRRKGKRWSNDTMNRVWKLACEEAGIKHITVYPATRHSSCTQFVNQKGGNIDELMVMTGHKRRDSALRYAKVNLDHKRRLMSRKVINLSNYKTATG